MNKEQLHNLLYESLETEKGGILVYEAALRCAQNEDLIEEWDKDLGQTRNHVEVLLLVLEGFGLSAEPETPGRQVIRHTGKSLVEAMEMALRSGNPEGAEIVAAECVVMAKTKDRLNWELLGLAGKMLTGKEKDILEAAVDEVGQEEDEHLNHSTGWARELHLQALGVKAELPPTEETKDVKTEFQSAKASRKLQTASRKQQTAGRKQRTASRKQRTNGIERPRRKKTA